MTHPLDRIIYSPAMQAARAVVASGGTHAESQTAYRFYHDGIETHALAVANDGLRHIPLPGAAVYTSTPHSAALALTATYRIQILVVCYKWALGGGINQTLGGKYNAAGSRASLFRILATGAIEFGWSTDGTALSVVSKALSNFPIAKDGVPIWLDIEFIGNDGSGNRVTNWRYAEFDGTYNVPTSWILATSDTTAGTVTIFNATGAGFTWGAWGSGSEGLNGKIYRGRVLDGSGNVVSEMNPNADATNGATSWTASTGEVHTCNGTNALAAQNTNVTLTVNTLYNVLLRVRRQETGAAAGSGTDDYQYQVSKNGGAYANIPASGGAINYRDSPTLDVSATGSAPTTNRLGAGTGSFVAGEITEDGLVDNISLTASNYTEDLVSLQIDPTQVANGDTYDFRVLRNGSVITYTVTPRITITKGFKYFTQAAAGSITPTGTQTRDHVNMLAGSITPTGAETRITMQADFGGAISPAGAISTVRIFSRSLDGGITPTGAITRTTTRGLAGGITPTGATTRALGHGIAGGISPAGVELHDLTRFLAGAIGPTGTQLRLITHGIGGAILPGGGNDTVLTTPPVVVRLYQIGDRIFAVSPS